MQESEAKALICCEKIIETFKLHYDGTHRLTNFEQLSGAALCVKWMQQIRPLDVDLTISLAKKNHVASECVEGQPIILLLGPTGAGKSTTIQFLVGLEMELIRVKGLRHIQCTTKSLQERGDLVLAEIVSSPNLKSETDCVRAVEVKFREHLGMEQDGSIFACDTPGFGDTGGSAVELAHAIGLVRAIWKAKEVRPLILFSRASVGERFEFLLQHVITLTSLVKNLDANVDSFSYLFTKYSAEEAEELNARLIMKRESLTEEEKCIQPLGQLLADMIKKTTEAVPLLEPLKEKPSKLMGTLLKATPIQNPQENFVPFVSASLLGVLSTQLNELELSINRGLTRRNFPLLEYRFRQLRDLALYLDLEQCYKKFQACRANLLQFIRADLEAILASLTKMFLPGNNAEINTSLCESLQALSTFVGFENLRSEYLNNEVANLPEEMLRQLDIHQKTMSQLVLTSCIDGKQPSWLEPVPYQQLRKMEVLTKSYTAVFGESKSLTEQEHEARNCLTHKMNSTLNAAKIAIQERTYDEFEASLQCITRAWEAGAKEIISQSVVDEAKMYPISHFAPQVQLFIEQLQQDHVNSDDARLIADLICDLRVLKTNCPSPELIEGLSALASQLCSACIAYIESRRAFIAKCLSSVDSQSLLEIQRVWDVARALSQPHEVSERAGKNFLDMTDDIRGTLQRTREKLELSLHENLEPEFASDLALLQLSVLCLSGELLGSLAEPVKTFLRSGLELVEKIQEEVENAVFEPPSPPGSSIVKYLKYIRLTELEAGSFESWRRIIDATARVLSSRLAAALQTSIEQLASLSLGDSQAGSLFLFWMQLSSLCSTLNLPELHENAKLLQQQTAAAVEHHLQEANAVFAHSCQYVFSRVENRAVPENSQPGVIFVDLSQLELQHQVVIQPVMSGLILRGSQSDVNACLAALSPKIDVSGVRRVQQSPTCELCHLTATGLAIEFSSILSGATAALSRLEKLAVMCSLEKKDASTVSPSQQACDAFLLSLERIRKAADCNDTKELEVLKVKLEIAQSYKKYDGLATRFGLAAFAFGEAETATKLLLKDLSSGFEANLRFALQSLDYADVNACHEEAKRYGEGTLSVFSAAMTARLESEVAQLSHEIGVIDATSGDGVQTALTNLARAKNCQRLVHFIASKELEEKASQILKQLGPMLAQVLELARNCIARQDFEKFEQILAILLQADQTHLQECGVSSADIEKLRADVTESLDFKTCYCSPCMFMTTDSLPTRESNLGFSDGAFVLSVDSEHSLLQMEQEPLQSYDRVPETKTHVLTQEDAKSKSSSWTQKIIGAFMGKKEVAPETTALTIWMPPETSPQPTENRRGAYESAFKSASLAYWKTSARLCVPIHVAAMHLMGQFSDSKPPQYVLTANECAKLEGIVGYSPARSDFDAIRRRPPQVLVEKLLQAGQNHPFYLRALEDLKKSLMDDLNVFLRLAPAETNPKQASDMLNVIKDLEQYLPLDWRGQLSAEKARLEEAVKAAQENLARKLKLMEETSSIHEMLQVFRQAVSARNDYWAEQCLLHIFAKTAQQLDFFADEMEKKPVSGVVHLAVALFKEAKGVYTQLPSAPFTRFAQELKPRVEVVRNKLLAKVDAANERFIDYFQTDNSYLIEGLSVAACWSFWKKLRKPQRAPKIALNLQLFIEDAVKHQSMFEDNLKHNLGRCSRATIDRIKFLDPVVLHAHKIAKEVEGLCPVFDDKIDSIRPYSYFQNELGRVVQQLESEMRPALGNAALLTPNASERDEFYTALMDKYIFLKSDIGQGHVACDMSACDNLEAHLKQELQQLEGRAKAIKYVPVIQSSGVYDDAVASYEKLHALFDNLRSIQQHFSNQGVASAADSAMESISREINDQLNLVGTSIETNSCTLQEKCDFLVGLKTFASNCFSFTDRVKKRIDKILEELARKQGGGDTIMKIGQILRSHTLAKMALPLISDHPAFAAMATYLRNQKTCRLGIEDIAAELKAGMERIDKKKLVTWYKVFDTKYWLLVDAGLADSNDSALSKLLVCTKGVAETTKKAKNDPEKILILLAHVFAYWTLHHSSGYRQAMESESKEQKHFLLQPHAAQVVAIMRLFGIEGPNCTITNHLIQVLTGEGKSVILSITATVLALLGYVVDCACYSEYLSNRDYEAFLFLFAAFNVEDAISYGTFNNLCEGMVNQHGDLRDMVVKMISGVGARADRITKMRPQGPRVLLIDEVDVFFSSSFYGNEYRPLALVKDQSISQLLRYVWSQRAQIPLSINTVRSSTEYKTCCSKFAQWKDLLDEALKDIMVSLANFPNHQYEVLGGRVCYKEQDSMNYNVSYGYLTMFAHLKAEDDKLIGSQIAEQSLALSVSCGSFSYAEIPKSYEFIIGVTGTLANLADSQQRILEKEYGIKKKTFLPSVYGVNHLVTLSNVAGSVQIVDSEGEHALKIIEAIKDVNSKNRAIFVFFETRERLRRFHNHSGMSQFKGFAKIITEETSALEKTNLIQQAATVKNVVLMTREFGRGTDFVCYDDSMNVNGGVHVVQTFPSDDKSEETQLGGRTARQGNKGSFGLILTATSLEKYGLTADKIADMHVNGTRYEKFDEYRQRWFSDMLGNEYLAAVIAVKEKHQLSMGFVRDMVAGKVAEARAYLLVENEGPRLAANLVRTLVLMDATGSMSSLLMNTKNTIGVMFERCEIILREKQINTRFEVKIGCYRNYNVNADLLLQVQSSRN